jgi:hypothetical protein
VYLRARDSEALKCEPVLLRWVSQHAWIDISQGRVIIDEGVSHWSGDVGLANDSPLAGSEDVEDLASFFALLATVAGMSTGDCWRRAGPEMSSALEVAASKSSSTAGSI